MEAYSVRLREPMHCKARSEVVIVLATMHRTAYQILSLR